MQSPQEERLQCEVLSELDSDPQVDADRIFVDVEAGIVRLSGTVPNLHRKLAAQEAVLRVKGVARLFSQLCVELSAPEQRNDADVARTIAVQLCGNIAIPTAVQVTVEGGNVLLTGTVDWQFEREEAASVARRIVGVRSVANAITLNVTRRDHHAPNARRTASNRGSGRVGSRSGS